MDFRNYLNEVMNTKIESFEILEDEHEIFRVKFTVGEGKTPYLVVFIFNRKKDAWEILFGLERELEIDKAHYSKRWAMKFTKDSNPFIVLKGVYESIKLFLKSKKNKSSICLYFRTTDDKRRNIFEKIITKLKKNKFAEDFTFDINDENGVSLFNLCKNKENKENKNEF